VFIHLFILYSDGWKDVKYFRAKIDDEWLIANGTVPEVVPNKVVIQNTKKNRTPIALCVFSKQFVIEHEIPNYDISKGLWFIDFDSMDIYSQKVFKVVLDNLKLIDEESDSETTNSMFICYVFIMFIQCLQCRIYCEYQ